MNRPDTVEAGRTERPQLEEEQVTARVVLEQAVRILCVISFLVALLLPIIVLDALGSVAPGFAGEVGIPFEPPSGNSQTRFTWDGLYLIQSSQDGFGPLRIFTKGAELITSSTGTLATVYGAAGLVSLGLLLVLPVVLYGVLQWSRHFEGPVVDRTLRVTVPVAAVAFLVIAAVLASFAIGYWWNFSWEYDPHVDFWSQYFMAYGGIKIAVQAVLALLIGAGCVAIWRVHHRARG